MQKSRRILKILCIIFIILSIATADKKPKTKEEEEDIADHVTLLNSESEKSGAKKKPIGKLIIFLTNIYNSNNIFSDSR